VKTTILSDGERRFVAINASLVSPLPIGAQFHHVAPVCFAISE
jgi:hypothetical protein